MKTMSTIKVNDRNYFIDEEEWNKQKEFRRKLEDNFPGGINKLK